MEPFSLLIKPASADCNLRCEYCFYLDRAALYPDTLRHRMSNEVLERLISSYMRTPQPEYVFGWQGGEPTLMGADFFGRVVSLQQQYGAPGSTVANGLQTNATLIDDELAALFGEYKFLAGVSMDGPPHVHNTYRRSASGRGSHVDVLRGIRRLEKHGVEFNILVLVSQSNVRRAAEVFRFLTDNGWFYHQYIPCVEFDAKGRLRPYAISGAEWGAFLCELFDVWTAGHERRVSIRLFDAVLDALVTGRRSICHFGDDCRQYLVVEHNGDVYPCDFFVTSGLRLGNIMTHEWSALRGHELYEKFGLGKSELHPECEACAWAWLCAGDCTKHRVRDNGVEPHRLSRLCAGWKQFYAHAMPRFKQLAADIRRERAGAAPPPAAAPGRNDPCPCGSGKKFKKCCMDKNTKI